MEIYDRYLHKPGFIGPEHGCQYKNLIEYCEDNIPDLHRKVTKNDDNNGQTMFILKNF